MVSHITSSLSTWASSQAGSALSASALQTIFGIQADLIINQKGMNPLIIYSLYTNAVLGMQHLLRSSFMSRITQIRLVQLRGRYYLSHAVASKSPYVYPLPWLILRGLKYFCVLLVVNQSIRSASDNSQLLLRRF